MRNSVAHSIEKPKASARSYDPSFFEKIVAIEDRHFWFQARNRIIAAAVKNVVKNMAPGYRVLEVGCGTGVVLRQLVQTCAEGEVTGIDLYPEAVELARKRTSCKLLVADILDAPALGEFDLIGSFDVLEHLPNDRQVLRQFRQTLRPKGALVLTVPARMSLWSYFDRASCHYRRYESQALIQLLKEEGFEIEYCTEFMMLLFPLLWMVRRLRESVNGAERYQVAAEAATELEIIPVLNGLLETLLSAERFGVSRGWRLPLGTSLLVVARRGTVPAKEMV